MRSHDTLPAMPSVGERLKAEREARDTTIDDMAAATGIGRSYLEAMEKNEIHVLPGRAFGKLYIRAYAEVLGFDPQPWIEDYDRERRFDPTDEDDPPPPEPTRPRAVEAAIAQWQESKTRARQEPKIEPEEVSHDAETAEPRIRAATLVVVGLALVGTIGYLALLRDGNKQAPPLELAPKPAVTLPPAERTPVEPIAPAASGAALKVSEFGVGRRVVNFTLEGESDHFATLERVCFFTRVTGGKPGGVIRHVWLHDGKVEQSIPLRLGGPDWRTHSNKTLGRAGSWTAEARDDRGLVLARASFTCGPSTRIPPS